MPQEWQDTMKTVEVLCVQKIAEGDRARIEAVDPAVRLNYAGGWFDGEIRETWPAFACRRYLKPDSRGRGTRAERDALLAKAEIILGGWPYPLDLRARSPRLKWIHQLNAGASNLRLGDLWGGDVVVTTSRGHGSTLPIAEYVLAGILHFSKGLDRARADRDDRSFSHSAYRPVVLAGKTMCVVGVGGIGREVGRLGAALGMRVVGTRRRAPAADAGLPDGFAEVREADGLRALLGESDFVAVCCQWTPETTGLIDRAAFRAMKRGCVLVNVARGEIVDEDALAEALDSGHLRGAVLDVYAGEFERPPPEVLWEHPRVLITPHVSGVSDDSRHRGIELFCENLGAYLHGRPLRNVIDWRRGY